MKMLHRQYLDCLLYQYVRQTKFFDVLNCCACTGMLKGWILGVKIARGVVEVPENLYKRLYCWNHLYLTKIESCKNNNNT